MSVPEFGFDLFEFQKREKSSQLYFTLVNTTNSIHRREIYSITTVLVDAMHSLTLPSFPFCLTIYISRSREREEGESDREIKR